MKYLGKKSASSVLQVVLDLAWYLGLIGVILLVLLQVYFLMGVLIGFPDLFPGSLQIETPGLIFRFTDGLPEKVLRAHLFVQYIVILLMLSIGLLIIYQLRRIFATMAGKTPFVGENVRRIRIIGIAVIIGSLLNTIARIMIGIYISSIVHVPGVELYANHKVDFGGIFLGGVTIILSEVFRYGVRLQEEQDHTV